MSGQGDTIHKDILIEDLVRILPVSVRYLKDKGIKCLGCGEPIWGTLESAAKEKGYDDDDIGRFVVDLNRLAAGGHAGQAHEPLGKNDSGA